jgi:hypothetical protein
VFCLDSDASHSSTEVSGLTKKIQELGKTNTAIDIDGKNELSRTTKSSKTSRKPSNKNLRRIATQYGASRARKEISEEMQDLRSAMESLQERGQVTKSDQELLKSLYFNGMKRRYKEIECSHPQTFQWIFQSSTPDNRHPIKFAEWLQGKNGIFWIWKTWLW